MDPGDGRAEGAVLSPLLSNIYLDLLDHLVAQAGFAMVRYADDFVILCRTPDEAARALELVQTWVSAAGLTLHPTKTKVVEAGPKVLTFWATTSRAAAAGLGRRAWEVPGHDPCRDKDLRSA